MSKLSDSIRQLKQKGFRVVGCFPLYPTVELLHSLGVIPIVLWDLKDQVRSLEESDCHIQGFACSVARRLAGFVLSDEGALLDGILMYNACDTLRNMPEIIQLGLEEKGRDLPLFRIHVPMAPRDQTGSDDYFAAGIRELVRGIESAFDVRFSPERFLESVKLYNAMRSLAVELEALAAAGRVSYGLFSRVIRDGYFLPVEEQILALEEAVRQASSVKARDDDGRGIIVTGILPPPEAVCAALEHAGLRVVGNDVASQARSYGRPAAETGDPVACYSDFYRNHMPCTTLLYTSDGRVRAIHDLIRERNARGLVFIGEKFCDCEYLEMPFIGKTLSALDVPDLQLEIAADDADNVESLRTRIEAFAELL
ncbi:MAG: 2-hydroxyacyl-CoA dehydratase [Spirochaetes bacterium]|nr:2-hydroxyacyl-CoA dehydratase [Spirochaetota bacterium]